MTLEEILSQILGRSKKVNIIGSYCAMPERKILLTNDQVLSQG